jgi:hypothetical protein
MKKKEKTRQSVKKTKKKEQELDRIIERMTLFNRFMLLAQKEYVPPLRQGTPKGEKIGYSLQKYSALFHLMRNWPLKEVARAAGVSYGVLRKWKTEKEFMKTHHELQVKYSYMFCGHIIEQHIRVYGNEVTDPFSFKYVDDPFNFKNDPLFADIDSYGEPLRRLIRDFILKTLKKRKKLKGEPKVVKGKAVQGFELKTMGDFKTIRAAYDVVELVYPEEGDNLKRELYRVIEPEMSNLIFGDLNAFIERKSHTKEDRLKALQNVKFIQWLLRNPNAK